jgi:phosphatidylglycerol:prolipoprotein diacylglycerol transferase
MLHNHIDIFGVTIHLYGLLTFLGIVVAYVVAINRAERYGVSFWCFLMLCAAAVTGMAVGSRVLHFITMLPALITDFTFPKLLNLTLNGGFVFYGGLFGALFAVKIYAKRSNHEKEKIFRIVTPAIPLFHGFGRIGCLFAGCCYGKELAEPIKLFGAVHIVRIPIQAFEAVFEFIMFFAILKIEKRRKDWNMLKFYLLAYAMFRFVNEFFRGDEIRGVFLLSTSQWISAAIVMYYFILGRRNRWKSSRCMAKR